MNQLCKDLNGRHGPAARCIWLRQIPIWGKTWLIVYERCVFWFHLPGKGCLCCWDRCVSQFCWCNMFFHIHNRRITLSILPFYLVFVPVAELPHTWCRTGLLLECSIESSKAVCWGKVFRHWAESMFNSDNFKTWLMVHRDLSNILIPCRIDYLASSVGHTWHFVTL